MVARSLLAIAATSLSMAFILTAGCASPVKVSSDYDPGADFASLKTWSWVAEESRVEGNTLLRDRVSSAVERTLGARGYRQVPSGPDFRVAFSFATQQQLDVRSTPNSGVYYGRGYRGRRGGVYTGWGGSTVDVRQYTEGTLIIDILEPNGERLFWRGTGTTRLREEKDPQKRIQKINEGVEKILAQFPPLG